MRRVILAGVGLGALALTGCAPAPFHNPYLADDAARYMPTCPSPMGEPCTGQVYSAQDDRHMQDERRSAVADPRGMGRPR